MRYQRPAFLGQTQYNATLRPLPVHPHLYLHWRTCYHYHLVKGLHSCFAPIERGFLGASRSKWYNIRNMPTVLFEGHSILAYEAARKPLTNATAASAIIHVTSPRRTALRSTMNTVSSLLLLLVEVRSQQTFPYVSFGVE